MMLLQVEHLRTSYGPVVVNQDASLSVDQHEIVTILGPNGAGKSTLLRAIAGLLRPRKEVSGSTVTKLPVYRPIEWPVWV